MAEEHRQTEAKGPGGRPTKYTNELIEKANHYVDNYKKYGDIVPTIAGLCIAIDIAYATAFAWSKDPTKTEFSDTFLKLETLQHKALVNGGLGGKFNPTIAKMMMTKHGYSDIQKIDHTSKGESMALPKPIDHMSDEDLEKELAKRGIA